MAMKRVAMVVAIAALGIGGMTMALADTVRIDLASTPVGALPKGFTAALTGGGVVAWSVVEEAFNKGGWRDVTRFYRRDDPPEEHCWMRAPGWSLAYR